MSAWVPRADGIALVLRVTPRSSREALGKGREGAFAARVNAAPVDGAANAAVIALVAGAFGVAKRDVAILSGEASRDKCVAVTGDSAALAEIAARLYGAAP